MGLVLIVTSGLLFALAFVTLLLPLEIGSLISFVFGVALVAVELEPRVKLHVSSDGMLGSLRALSGALGALRLTGKTTYVPVGGQVKMVITPRGKQPQDELPSVGEGLHAAMVEQLGEMVGKGFDFFSFWIPKMLVEGFGASDQVKVSRQEDDVTVSIRRPFVRLLCVDPFVTANVCCRMGCPLAGSVAQALASTTGREIEFENCTYDPKLQLARTSLKIGRSPAS
jgi:hypothetical protein